MLDSVKILGKVFEPVLLDSGRLSLWSVLKQLEGEIQVYQQAETICNIMSLENYSLTGETMKEVYLNTLIAGRDCGGQEARKQCLDFWDRTTGQMNRRALSKQSWHSFLRTVSLAISLGFQSVLNLFRADAPPETFENFSSIIQVTINNRRFCRTATGYIGILPDSAEQDNEIFLLKGCLTPMVLRASALADQWTLIGPCYLHGVMQGQLWGEEKCHDVWPV
jgi:hypothetical protein